ncbi:hypothetical protein VE04_02195 [Pseudogymnoascus sp. 24MN13]|nr:hypothetical protein VE04_02194 [Pseudogymnoascus sp. 24MN13]OBT57860.1 hypothetical protein VE04_02195 [Pseudogymnoascus sp. 24MN13]
MVAPIPFAQAALVVLLACARTSAQTTSAVMPMFFLDSAPLSLEAAIISVGPVATWTYQTIVTYSVDCPKSASPDNDACRAKSIYPAEVWHTQGSMWGGTTTALADDGTTTWLVTSRLGSREGMGQSINAAGGATRVETTWIDSCYISAHSVPMLVTAGAEKLPEQYHMMPGVSEWNSIISSELSSMGCAVSSTTAMTSAASTTSSNGGASETGGTIPTTGATATQGQASDTAAGSASPSSTATGESSGTFREMSLLIAVGAVAICLII